MVTNLSRVSPYNEQYWRFQEPIGRFGGIAEQGKFAPYVKPTDYVIDYGCGGGFILANLDARKKVGIEVNPTARSIAREQGIETHERIADAPGGADVVISNHALEHVESPLGELREMHKKLRPGGRLVLVVPSENHRRWDPTNRNFHLYTWSPLNLGNLLTAAGFRVIECEQRYMLWPPRPQLVQKYLGWRLFHLLSYLRGVLTSHVGEVRAVADA